ncbi:ribokinase, partial [Escherichia coli]
MRKFIRGSEMDIAVIGSNMVDLITYTNQMPKEGETLEA